MVYIRREYHIVVAFELGDSPPDRGDAWRIEHVGWRACWQDCRAACAVCGRQVSLDERHYHARLTDGPRGRPHDADSETVVFCSRACFERWGER